MTDVLTPEPQPTKLPWWRSPEALVSLIGFLGFSVLVLVRATQMLEPDDYAYRASIAALSHGHILLTNAQYSALNQQLAASGGQGISQWHHMASGLWISEKNPGYPFYAIVFYLLHLLRIAPLFYGLIACFGLYHGAKAWIGKWAGAVAVWVYCFSGAALTFAWRATMPSFTDASLIAAGFGGLLWVFLSTDQPLRRRAAWGLLSFIALDSAVFIRYTNIIELAVATLAVVVFRRNVRLPLRTVGVWMSSVVATGVLILGFDAWAYGKATSTGYSAGEITFSFSSFWPNLKGMPSNLISSLPMLLLGLAAIAWIVFAGFAGKSKDYLYRQKSRNDLAVAGVLASGWLGLWFLYLNYTWTANMLGGGHGGPGGPGGAMGGQTVHLIRFYIPALGLVALLATRFLMRLPRYVRILFIIGLVCASWFSYSQMASAQGPGGIGGGFGGNGPGGGSTHFTPPSGNGNFTPTPGKSKVTPPSGNSKTKLPAPNNQYVPQQRTPSGSTNDGGPDFGQRPPDGNPPDGGPGGFGSDGGPDGGPDGNH